MKTITTPRTTGETHVDESAEHGRPLKAIAVELARELATFERLVVGEWVRSDIYQVRVECPVSPVELNVKHYSKGRDISDQETGRINVSVHHSGVSNGTLIRKAREKGLDVVDVWQLGRDLDREMGQHNEPAIQIGLERID